MTREIIFEAFRGGKFWRKLLCKLTCHVWTKIFDIQIGEYDNYAISMIIWQCIHCKVNQLWIGKELELDVTRKE